MPDLLITPTLINGFQFYQSFDNASREDFLRLLSRQKSERTEAMQAGIDFEDAIKRYCDTGQTEKEIVKEIGDICKNGLWQVTVCKSLDNYLLYGKADVIKYDTIYDIKHTKSYDMNKYYNSMQHLLYMYCTDIPNFAYLISDEKNVYREDYVKESDMVDRIKSKITDFIDYLKADKEASDLFYKNWKSKRG